MTVTSPISSIEEKKFTFGQRVKGFFELTKPRVMELLLTVTIPAMFLAQRGFPDFWLVIVTLIGGAFAAGASGVFNCYIDRDIDALMSRTKKRPLVTGVVKPWEALVFGAILTLLSIAIFILFTNWVAAALAAAAIFFYVVVYSLVLKRRTAQNIVWGGIAGCFPVVIGWAAVTGTIDPAAWIMFLVIFLWTPPHYWPLAIKYREDYESVDVPMLPVVRNRTTVGLQIILYSWAMVISAIILIPVGQMGVIYTTVAIISGIWFLYEAHRLYLLAFSKSAKSGAMRVFHGSISYLTVLFIAIAVDAVVPF